MRDTRRFIEHRLRNLSTLWEGEPRIAREAIAKHVQKIISQTSGWRVYSYGDLGLAGSTGQRGYYGGAGGGNWTERLPVHFKWLAAA